MKPNPPRKITYHVEEADVRAAFHFALKHIRKKHPWRRIVLLLALLVLSYAASVVLMRDSPFYVMPWLFTGILGISLIITHWVLPFTSTRNYLKQKPDILGQHELTVLPGVLIHTGPTWENRLKLALFDETLKNSEYIALIFNNSALTIPKSALEPEGPEAFLDHLRVMSERPPEEEEANEPTENLPLHGSTSITIADQIVRNQTLYTQLNRKKRLQHWLVRSLFVAVALINVGVTFPTSGFRTLLIWLPALILVLGFVPTWKSVGIPLWVRWKGKRNPTRVGVGALAVKFGPTGGWFQSGLGEGSFRWEQVTGLDTFEQHTIVAFGPGRSLIIPDRAWENANAAKEQLREWKTESLRQPLPVRSKEKGAVKDTHNVFAPPDT